MTAPIDGLDALLGYTDAGGVFRPGAAAKWLRKASNRDLVKAFEAATPEESDAILDAIYRGARS